MMLLLLLLVLSVLLGLLVREIRLDGYGRRPGPAPYEQPHTFRSI